MLFNKLKTGDNDITIKELLDTVKNYLMKTLNVKFFNKLKLKKLEF